MLGMAQKAMDLLQQMAGDIRDVRDLLHREAARRRAERIEEEREGLEETRV